MARLVRLAVPTSRFRSKDLLRFREQSTFRFPERMTYRRTTRGLGGFVEVIGRRKALSELPELYIDNTLVGG